MSKKKFYVTKVIIMGRFSLIESDRMIKKNHVSSSIVSKMRNQQRFAFSCVISDYPYFHILGNLAALFLDRFLTFTLLHFNFRSTAE